MFKILLLEIHVKLPHSYEEVKQRHMEMRLVNYKYINQVHGILNVNHLSLSSKRLRRLAYLDVYFQSYQQFDLYNKYKKIVHSDASNNQMIVLGIVLLLLGALIIILSKVGLA